MESETMEELLARSELSKLKPLPRKVIKQMNTQHDPQFMGNKFECYLLGFLLVVAPISALILDMCGLL